MDRSARFLRVELQTFQIAECSRRNVIQAIEPEAEHVLVEAGGKVLETAGRLYIRRLLELSLADPDHLLATQHSVSLSSAHRTRR